MAIYPPSSDSESSNKQVISHCLNPVTKSHGLTPKLKPDLIDAFSYSFPPNSKRPSLEEQLEAAEREREIVGRMRQTSESKMRNQFLKACAEQEAFVMLQKEFHLIHQ